MDNKLSELSIQDFPYLQNFGLAANYKKHIDKLYPRDFANGDFDSFKNFVDTITSSKPPIYLFFLNSFRFFTTMEQNEIIKHANYLENDEGVILFDPKCLTHYKIINAKSGLYVEFIISMGARFPAFYSKIRFETDGTHDIVNYETEFKIENFSGKKEFSLNFAKSLIFFSLYTEFMTPNIMNLPANKKLKSKTTIRNKLNDSILIPDMDAMLAAIRERGDKFSEKSIKFDFDEPNRLMTYKIIDIKK